MNRARAQEILSGYRPNRDSATDPEIAAALALLEQDAELARWFEREQAQDAALQRKFREIPVPADLQDRILASRPKRLTRPNWWSEPRLLAAAAVLVIASASVLWLAPREPARWPDFQAQAVGKVTASYDLDTRSRNHDEVRKGMAVAGFPSDYLEPPGLLTYPLKGGFRYRWQGHKVSVVCYGSSLERKPEVWLMVLKRSEIAGAPTGATPEFGVMGEVRVARWADGQHFYMLATQDGPDLEALF